MDKYCCHQMATQIQYGYIEFTGTNFFMRVPHMEKDEPVSVGTIGMSFCPFCGMDIKPYQKIDTKELVFIWEIPGKKTSYSN